jgi:hypothetical protein
MNFGGAAPVTFGFPFFKPRFPKKKHTNELPKDNGFGGCWDTGPYFF